MTIFDSESPAAQLSRWLGAGLASWSAPLADGTTGQYPIHPAGAHSLAPLLEQHLPAFGDGSGRVVPR
jgi:hypothetical protein